MPNVSPTFGDGGSGLTQTETIPDSRLSVAGVMSTGVGKIREPHIVHDARGQHAGERRQALIRLVGPAGPARRQTGRPEVRERAVAIVRVPREALWFGWSCTSTRSVELISHVRTGEDSAERSKFVDRLDRDHAGLVGALVAPEEEGPISAHRAADMRAELVSLEERIVVVRNRGSGPG